MDKKTFNTLDDYFRSARQSLDSDTQKNPLADPETVARLLRSVPEPTGRSSRPWLWLTLAFLGLGGITIAYLALPADNPSAYAPVSASATPDRATPPAAPPAPVPSDNNSIAGAAESTTAPPVAAHPGHIYEGKKGQSQGSGTDMVKVNRVRPHTFGQPDQSNKVISKTADTLHDPKVSITISPANKADVMGTEPDEFSSPQSAIQSFVGNYWTEKLNDYRSVVDGLMKPEDRAALNLLRLRMNAYIGRGDKAGSAEQLKILTGARTLAARYRTGLNLLKTTVTKDFDVFIDSLMGVLASYMNRLSTLIPADLQKQMKGQMQQVAVKLKDEASDVKVTIGGQVFESGNLYAQYIEPMIILYNGSDLKLMMQGVQGTAVTGLPISENLTLQQSIPDPTRGMTTVRYNPGQNCTAATLSVFDATGREYQRKELGAQPEGLYVATVDVSDLPEGTYVYMLTVQTPAGQRVTSRTMRVQR